MTDDTPVPATPPPDHRRDRTGGLTAVAAAAATITAVVAVAIAYLDNVQMRRHNRLSVQPYVVLQQIRNDSAGVVRGRIALSNEGVGPAILRGLEIALARPDGTDTVVTRWGQAAPMISSFGVQIRGWADVDSGAAVGIQRGTVLLRFQAEGEGAGDRVQSVLEALRLRLRYASVYGDQAETTLGD